MVNQIQGTTNMNEIGAMEDDAPFDNRIVWVPCSYMGHFALVLWWLTSSAIIHSLSSVAEQFQASKWAQRYEDLQWRLWAQFPPEQTDPKGEDLCLCMANLRYSHTLPEKQNIRGV